VRWSTERVIEPAELFSKCSLASRKSNCAAAVMDDGLGPFYRVKARAEMAPDPFGPEKVLPMSPAAGMAGITTSQSALSMESELVHRTTPAQLSHVRSAL